TVKEPLTGKEPPANKEPLPGKEPPAAKEPSATKEPQVAKEPLTGKEPPANKEPLAGKEPPTVKEPLTGKEPPATKDPLTAKEPLVSKEPSAGKEIPFSKGTTIIKGALPHASDILSLITKQTKHALATSTTATDGSVENTKTNLSLKKLNALLNSLKISGDSRINSQEISARNESDLKPLRPIESNEQLQRLTKQLQQNLPDMRQLTNAPMLSNMIEQFTRFDPLQPASINLRHLGSLASAIQLILGFKAASSTKADGSPISEGKKSDGSSALTPGLSQGLSSALTEQLKKILGNGKSKQPNKSNLIQGLLQLGNLSSLKLIEESLTALSGHLKLYQYQSQEQSNANNQTIFFTIPTSEPSIPQVEGQIERGNKDQASGQRVWQLTLLLPVGNTDKIQASAKLQGNNLELELVSNNQEMVDKAKFFADFLSQRLTTLGLTVSDISCKQAELPKSLLKRPNQLVELMV
ncbi:MAG: hypothetical protein HRU22_17700, partial [Gammaproteobacteria bacterium]|nr:hypothetical protein [Gammaproteobacteria bacterium]